MVRLRVPADILVLIRSASTDRSSREPKKRSADQELSIFDRSCFLQSIAAGCTPSQTSPTPRIYSNNSDLHAYTTKLAFTFLLVSERRWEYELNSTKSGALCLRRRRRSAREKHKLLEGVVAHHKAKAAPFSLLLISRLRRDVLVMPKLRKLRISWREIYIASIREKLVLVLFRLMGIQHNRSLFWEKKPAAFDLIGWSGTTEWSIRAQKDLQTPFWKILFDFQNTFNSSIVWTF